MKRKAGRLLLLAGAVLTARVPQAGLAKDAGWHR